MKILKSIWPDKAIRNQLLTMLIITTFFGVFATSIANAQDASSELPKEKQTTLGLYVTSREAYDMWKSAPDKIKILDVRTHFEYLYIGHSSVAWNIPIFFQWYEYDAINKHFPMKPNPDFMKQVTDVFQPEDIILVTCRSGGRSAIAVNQLAEAGFKNVYNITDGFEGDKVKDPNSVFNGQRMENGWKNSGLPWTYDLDPKLMLLTDEK